MTNDKYTIGPAQPTPPTICIKANDGRALLTIKPDGTVTGEIEDASEAARLFVESLRGYFPQPTQSDALVEALERCAQIVEQWNHRQNEKVEDVKYVARNAIKAFQEQSK